MVRKINLPSSDDISKLGLFNLEAAGVDGHATATTALGTTIVKAVEIFKSGTFKDSMGEQRTWTNEQLAMMVANFEILRDSDQFPNVPVRRDHSWSVDDVIGYLSHLEVTGDRLVADIEFTEPDDLDKFVRGTYRSRSLEVGMYETNDGVTYWPVVMGLAFVDIPAVEGLHRVGNKRVASYSLQKAKEPKVPDQETFLFSIKGEQTSDYARVATYVATLEAEKVALVARNEQLEAFAADQVKATRHNFVTALSDSRKIVATQVENLKLLVETMSDEQWNAFQAVYETAPAHPLLTKHVDGVSNAAGDGIKQNDEVEVLEEIISLHRKSGMSEDAIKKTSSYTKLAALKGN